MRNRPYRHLTTLFLSVMVLGMSSCDALRTVYVDVTAETTVESSWLSLVDFQALGFDNFASFDVSNSSEFENQGAGKQHIGESYVTGFVLEVTAPDDGQLNFIDELEIYISDSDGEQRTRVAYLPADADTNTSTLYLAVHDDRDISQYLRADSTVIEFEAKGESPDQDTTIEATLTLAIKLAL